MNKILTVVRRFLNPSVRKTAIKRPVYKCRTDLQEADLNNRIISVLGFEAGVFVRHSHVQNQHMKNTHQARRPNTV
ncbi:hypothetical protein AZ468_18350 [Vibrio europaeus]|uniref:Uncharacterized protein n=1 Tax=Vibrio europaeus TaxID=300876 RepID=A0A178J7J2_9VIBR|nr:hypothetical protein AZ468_18350 [Vibrio europaeus]